LFEIIITEKQGIYYHRQSRPRW